MVTAHSHKRRVGLRREEGPGARCCSMEIELWKDVVNEVFLIGRSKETGPEIPQLLEVTPLRGLLVIGSHGNQGAEVCFRTKQSLSLFIVYVKGDTVKGRI